MGTIKTSEETPPQAIGFFNGFGTNGIVVLLKGEVFGPFDEPSTALAWCYQVCKDDIYSMKQLLNPHLLME